MRLSRYITEKKKMERTMIGYKVDESQLKRISKYIKSFLIRYNIEFVENKNLHITVAQIKGKYEKDELTREVQKLTKSMTFNPKEFKVLYGKFTNRDYLVIEYKRNDTYIKTFDEIIEKFPEVQIFEGGMKPHTSLFNIEHGKMPKNILDDMLFSMPKLPRISVTAVELFNKKFQVEFGVKI